VAGNLSNNETIFFGEAIDINDLFLKQAPPPLSELQHRGGQTSHQV